MNMKCETVKVAADNDEGYMVINKSDLTDEHEVLDPVDPEPAKLSKDEMKEMLDNAGVEYPSNANKADLQTLIDENLTDPE